MGLIDSNQITRYNYSNQMTVTDNDYDMFLRLLNTQYGCKMQDNLGNIIFILPPFNSNNSYCVGSPYGYILKQMKMRLCKILALFVITNIAT